MFYFINKKNIKQSINNMSQFLKNEKIEIPRNILLEMFSKSLFFKNWNTLEGIISKPKKIKQLQNKKSYLLEIDTDMPSDDFLNLVKKSFTDAKCVVTIDDFVSDKNSFYLEINFPNKTDNFLTGIVILSEQLKKFNTTRVELLRIIFEKENLTKLFNDKQINYY